VPPGGDAFVELTLSPPSGPGTLRGHVTAGDDHAPLAGLTVAVAGGVSTTTGADGAFVLAGAGPGPVSVTVRGDGIEPIDEAVQVAPEATVELELAAHRVGAHRELGTLRGLIRSKAGKPVAATVRILEAKVRTKVGSDGRFMVRVPGGRYTVTIEAPGFVAQTLSVELADGDHAIFDCDLEPLRR
jgi:hypothetical protein